MVTRIENKAVVLFGIVKRQAALQHERHTAYFAFTFYDGDGADIAVAEVQPLQPTFCEFATRMQRNIDIRAAFASVIDWHLKPGQRSADADAERFEQGLLTRPTMHERGVAIGRRRGIDRFDFVRMKVSLGDVLGMADRAETFHVDADFALMGHDDQGQLIGVSHVEVKLGHDMIVSEPRLSIRVDHKQHIVGCDAKVPRQQNSERGACRYETISRRFKVEIVGSSLFVRVEKIPKCSKSPWRNVQRHCPHVCFIRWQQRMFSGCGPIAIHSCQELGHFI